MLKILYSALRFLFEVASLLIAGYWGFSRFTGPLRLLLGLGVPLLIMLFWATWGAPMAAHRLSGLLRLGLELSIYLACGLLLYFTGLRQFTGLYLLTGLVNALINHFTGWLV